MASCYKTLILAAQLEYSRSQGSDLGNSNDGIWFLFSNAWYMRAISNLVFHIFVFFVISFEDISARCCVLGNNWDTEIETAKDSTASIVYSEPIRQTPP